MGRASRIPSARRLLIAGASSLLALSCGGQTREAPRSNEADPAPSTRDADVDVATENTPDSGPVTDPVQAVLRDFKNAGHLRGSNLCQCVLPNNPNDLEMCATDEGGAASLVLRSKPFESCVTSLARSSPALVDYLACETDHLLQVAECEKMLCPKIDPCLNMGKPCEFATDLQKQWNACLQ